MAPRFHNPRPQVRHQNLRCWLYAQQLKQAQDNYQMQTRKDSINSPFDLLTESFSMYCRNFLTSLILSHREIPVEYRLITCLPKAFSVFLPLSFSSRCLYSAYVLLIISSLSLSTLLCVHLCSNLPLSMRFFKHSRVFYVAECLLLVYQQYLQESHHRLMCLQHQPSSLLNVEIGSI